MGKKKRNINRKVTQKNKKDNKNSSLSSSSYSSYSSYSSSSSENVVTIRGLLNIGNTCFFNSSLQSLVYSINFIDWEVIPLKIYSTFLETMKTLSIPSNKIVNPGQLLNVLTTKVHQFNNRRQHDSHELLIHLISSILEEFEKKEIHDHPFKSLFNGSLVGIVQCQNCDYRSCSLNKFVDLSLEIPGSKHLFKYPTKQISYLTTTTRVLRSQKKQSAAEKSSKKDNEDENNNNNNNKNNSNKKNDIVSQASSLSSTPVTTDSTSKKDNSKNSEVNNHKNNKKDNNKDTTEEILNNHHENGKIEGEGGVEEANSSSAENIIEINSIELLQSNELLPTSENDNSNEKCNENDDNNEEEKEDEETKEEKETKKEKENNLDFDILEPPLESIQLSKSGEISLFDCLKEYTSREILNTESGNGYCCPNCSKESSKKIVKRNASKRLLLFNLPSLLIIHLKRLLPGGKCSSFITFPTNLQLDAFLGKKKSSDSNDSMNEENQIIDDNSLFEYQLCSVIVHQGTGNGGHYIAYVNRENQWYFTSDSVTRKASLSEVLGSQAYILMYRKIERQNIDDRIETELKDGLKNVSMNNNDNENELGEEEDGDNNNEEEEDGDVGEDIHCDRGNARPEN